MEEYERAFELAKENTERLLRNLQYVDNKIYNTIVITGIILSALTGFSLLSPTSLAEHQLSSISLLSIYTFGLGLIFVSLITSIINYTLSSPKITLFKTNLKELDKMKNVNFKGLIKLYAEADEVLIRRNYKKWRLMKVSIIFLTGGLFFVVFSTLYSLTI